MIGDRGGDGKGRGVYSRSFEALFEMSKKRELTMGAKYEFRVSLMEIYNETVRGLLADPDSATNKTGLHIVVRGVCSKNSLVSLINSCRKSLKYQRSNNRYRNEDVVREVVPEVRVPELEHQVLS